MIIYSLFDEFLDGVFIFDENKNIVYCNEMAATIFGTRPKRTIGKKTYDIFKIQDATLFCTESGTSGKDGIGAYVEVPYEGKDTSGYVQIMVKPCPIYPNEKHWLGYFHNMTEEQALSRKYHKETEEREKANELATRDAMTGLKNFRGFNLYVAEAMAKAIDQKENLGLVIIDVDKFKVFNDTYGHQQGDEVLKVVGKTLQSSVRKSDFVARYGGEEFVMVICDATLDGINYICEKVRANIEAAKVDDLARPGETLSVTASFGAVCITSNFLTANKDQDYKFFLEYADKNLYGAKEAGRNRSVVSTL
jgi:diguanylate cyclase (GGDEF)-like protein/PAS domain S-box-containing protein